MGFKKIYIIGADFNYSSNMQSESNHFYGDKDKKSYVNLPFRTNDVLFNYEGIRKYCEKIGVDIYNATRGGKLDVLERVDLDKVLSE